VWAADSQGTLDKVRALLKDESSWINLERRDQYAMLGYNHDTSKILYTADYTSLKLCPTESEDHLWKDIQLSKESSSPKATVTVNLKDSSGEEKATRLEVWKSRWAGVQVPFLLISSPRDIAVINTLPLESYCTGLRRRKNTWTVFVCAYQEPKNKYLYG